MDSQQPKPDATGPQGYAQLSEEESQPSNVPEAQQPSWNNQQRAPVIVQGIPAMSYPVSSGAPPMSTFEIYPQAPSPLDKLKTCPYECYTYWLYFSIFCSGLVVFLALVGQLLLGAPFKVLEVVATLSQGVHVYVCVLICIGIHKRSLEKLNQGVLYMKLSLAGSAIISFFQIISTWDEVVRKGPLKDTICQRDACEPEEQSVIHTATIASTIISLGLGILLFLVPAIKIRGILEAASNSRNINRPGFNA